MQISNGIYKKGYIFKSDSIGSIGNNRNFSDFAIGKFQWDIMYFYIESIEIVLNRNIASEIIHSVSIGTHPTKSYLFQFSNSIGSIRNE